MQRWLRLVQLLSMTVWVGGLVFFAFVLAPTAFQLLPIHDAGRVVGAALHVFDVVAMSWGILFLFATYNIVHRLPRGSRRFCRIQFVVALGMLLLTAFIHWGILPLMDADQLRAGGDILTLPASDLTRIHFNTLHVLSEAVEGTVLALGLGVLFLLSREMRPIATDSDPPTAA